MKPTWILPCLLLLPAALYSCGGAGDRGTGATQEDTLARDRVAAMVANTRYDQARSVLAPLVAREDAWLSDLQTAAIVELQDGNLEAAQGFLQRCLALDASSAGAHYLQGRIYQLEGNPLAVESYRRALALAPLDLATRYVLAQTLEQQDEFDEALELCREIEVSGMAEGGPWFVSSVYLQFRIHNWIAEDDEALRKYTDLWEALQQRGLRAVKEAEINEGELARVRPPESIGNRVASAVSVPDYKITETLLPEFAGCEELLADDLDGDRRTDLVAAGPTGVFIGLQEESGGWRVLHPFKEAASMLRTIDLHKDDSLDLLFTSQGQLQLLEARGEAGADTWEPTPLELPALPGPPADMCAVDYDHDGDLDLLVVGSFGGRLLRNDGAGEVLIRGEAQPRGGFTDASLESGLPAEGDYRWCDIEDLDSDQDVDLLMGGPGVLWVGSSMRGGQFEEVGSRMFGEVDLATRPLLSDFDGDARPDALLSTSTGSTLFLQQQDGTLRGESIAIPPAAQLIEVDLDLDGALDVLWTGAEGDTAGALFAASLEQETAAPLEPLSGQTTLTVADLESGYEERLSWELLQLGSEGVQVLRTESPVGKAMRVRFRGKKDNRQGIGAVVELRAGPSYRRHFWRGTTTLYGLGDREYFDVVRVTWPNGVVGNELDVEAGNQILEGGSGLGVQTEGLVGSCPFLYTWNGETFEFISDVLGITPLGLPMAPGLLVPPDHDEYVLVRGDQLVQQDGQYVLQFTEELREVTYLDFVRLDVVDHPAGTEIQPNERFCFPPFPEHRTHVLSQVLEPRRATGSDGKDWTQALAQVDDIHAESFQPLADAQFLGLAEPHWMELEFDPSVLSALPAETELRLICTGWFYWCDASVNMASARTPGVDFTPPLLQIPGADGWVPTGPPVGFPAGKTKTMVLDVSKILSKEDPRIRIFSTLRLYWDSIRLAVGPDQQQRTTSLPPVAARLWSRGFSEPILTDRNDLPERFEWDRLARHPRWNQHPGHYTKYGDVLVLTEAVEDQFVIMGSGDALEIRFDATQLPAVPEGWERDFLVYLDGWAKDRDPNSIQALEVEPLPFHGMGSYPYPSEVSFPDTPAHRKWRQEWNTRAGYEHVIPLSPLREREWIR